MQSIPISLAKPEMMLAHDLVHPDNPSGPPICGKGMMLTESLLERLKAMGVKKVTVEGHPVCQDGDMTLDQLLNQLDYRFSRVTGDPLMTWLKELYRERLIISMKDSEPVTSNG
jgi:hypothetical protein